MATICFESVIHQAQLNKDMTTVIDKRTFYLAILKPTKTEAIWKTRVWKTCGSFVVVAIHNKFNENVFLSHLDKIILFFLI